MNQMPVVTKETFLRSKQSVTVAIDQLNWLAERNLEIGQLQQQHLDEWTSSGTTTQLIADRFPAWLIRRHLVDHGLKVRAHRRGTSPRMSAGDQALAIQKVIDSDDLVARDRAAAILVLVFGQQVEKVVTLTWDDITITKDCAVFQLGGFSVDLGPPLDQPWRELASARGNVLTAAHPHSNWVFLGTAPGRHLDAGHLSNRLRRLFSARAARLGTLHELAKTTPIAVIAEALGYSPATLERHAAGSANAYEQYVAAVQQQR